MKLHLKGYYNEGKDINMCIIHVCEDCMVLVIIIFTRSELASLANSFYVYMCA